MRGSSGRSRPAPKFPKTVTAENLTESHVLVLCSPRHWFARRQRRGGVIPTPFPELLHEHIVARELFRSLFPTAPRGGWTSVAHTADVYAYARLGTGVGLTTGFGFDISGTPSDLVALPLDPPVFLTSWLLLPRKRWRPLLPEAEELLDDLRAYGRSVRAEQRKLTAQLQQPAQSSGGGS